MGMLIENPALEAKVRTLASLTGESVEEAIATAADERLARIRPAAKRKNDPTVEEVLAMVRSFGLRRINDNLTEDEILGYGPHGYPE